MSFFNSLVTKLSDCCSKYVVNSTRLSNCLIPENVSTNVLRAVLLSKTFNSRSPLNKQYRRITVSKQDSNNIFPSRLYLSDPTISYPTKEKSLVLTDPLVSFSKMNFLQISFSPRWSKVIVTDTSSLSPIPISALHISDILLSLLLSLLVSNNHSKASKKVVLPSPLSPITRVKPSDSSKQFSP